MITRKQRISGEFTHREYYGQFVNNSILKTVVSRIGLEALRKSTDEHLNDIPLARWDRLPLSRETLELLKEADPCGWSLSDKVCIYKQAARQVIESL